MKFEDGWARADMLGIWGRFDLIPSALRVVRAIILSYVPLWLTTILFCGMISQFQMFETVYLAPADLHSHPLLFCGIRFRCLHSSLNVLFACLSWVRTYCRRRLSPSTELKTVACTNLEAYIPKFQGPVLGNINAIVTSKRLHISIHHCES